MSEYYGVAPSSDFFMHYGVKGMKWGVRRLNKYQYTDPAYQKGMERQFRKASAKLSKLKAKGNQQKTDRFREAMVDTFRATDYNYHQNDKTRALEKQMWKMEEDFYKSPAREKIIRQLAKEAAKKYSDGSKESIKQYYDGYKYDDLDQGDSFARYRQQNKKAGAAYAKLEKRYDAEYKRLREHPAY